jgi:acyl-coenzyme A synthetase/AMP-(fatty) acid ligase
VHERPDKIGTCGRALPDGALTIEQDQIIYTGPNVMMGYADSRTDLGRGDECRGRLATGDLGRIDAESYLTVTGRAQRFAKLFGLRISLDDLERIAGKIAPAASIESGDKIILATTAQEQAEQMRNFVATETGLQAAWIEVRGIAALPHGANGKIDYRKLREIL